MTRKIEFIGLNDAAEAWLVTNSATPNTIPNPYFDTFGERFDLRSWTVAGNVWLEKVQQELQFPKPYIFTKLIRQSNPAIEQDPWALVTVGLSDSRAIFNKFFGQIFTS